VITGQSDETIRRRTTRCTPLGEDEIAVGTSSGSIAVLIVYGRASLRCSVLRCDAAVRQSRALIWVLDNAHKAAMSASRSLNTSISLGALRKQ